MVRFNYLQIFSASAIVRFASEVDQSSSEGTCWHGVRSIERHNFECIAV